MALRILITAPQTGINMEKLKAELIVVFADVTGVSFAKGNYYVDLIDDSPVTQQQLQAIVDVHNAAILTPAQLESAQATSAKTTLQALMSGLHGLSAQDKGYAVYGRIFAARNGANQATLDGITNKATAQAYITGLPEWQNMTAASKAFFAKELEANAGLCMVLMLVLTG